MMIGLYKLEKYVYKSHLIICESLFSLLSLFTLTCQKKRDDSFR